MRRLLWPLLALLLAACTTASIPKTGPLAPCDPPCWNGITPGVTTLDEARARLRQYLQPPDALNEATFTDESVELNWYAANQGLNAVGASAGVVRLVSINVDGMTAGDVLAQYGPPPAQLGLQRQGSERVLYAVTFLYPDRGLSLLLRTGRTSLLRPSPTRGFAVQPDTPVTAIRYLPPGPLDEFVVRVPEVRRAGGAGGVETARARLRPWAGYGDDSLTPLDIPAN